MKIPLSISTDYVPTWGVREGLREIVQNWLDAQDSHGEGSCEYSPRTSTLTLRNPGHITRDALLLGVTSKADGGHRGLFGEGLKLGALALLRKFKTFKVTTRDEIWKATIGHHEAFPGRNVLVFDCRQRPDPGADEVVVEVGGIDLESWHQTKRGILRAGFTDPGAYHEEPMYGRVLLDQDKAGMVFVKGILVLTDAKFKFGYDLADAKVDRDRKLVDPWDMTYAMARIIFGAAEAGVPGVDLLDLVSEQRADVESMTYMGDAHKFLAAKFTERYGSGMFPVATVDEARALEHDNVKTIPVGARLAQMLKGGGLDAMAERDRNLRAPSRMVPLAEVTEEQLEAWYWATRNARIAFDHGIDEARMITNATIAEFSRPTLLAVYRNGQIVVSSKLLNDRYELLATLIHEVAHQFGGDGEHGHVGAIEKAWTHLVRSMT